MCWVWAGAGFTDTRPSSGGVGHLNKSLQCSEVSANRASVTGGAPGDRAAHSSWERGVRSEKTTPAKTTPKGCHLSRVLKRGLCSLGRRPWRLLWGWQQPLETALCVPEATSPQVLGTGRGEGRRDSTWGGRRGGDMLQRSDLQGLSALTLAALWLLRPQMALQGWPASICWAGGWGGGRSLQSVSLPCWLPHHHLLV